MSIEFDGVNESITFAAGSSPTFAFDRLNAFSISVWAYHRPNTLTNTLISKIIELNEQGYTLQLDSNSNLTAILQNSAGNRIEVVTTGVTQQQWNHYCFTYDGSSTAAGVNLYVNGILLQVTIVEDTLSATIANAALLQIGRRAELTNPRYYKGLLDDIAVWNKELSHAEVIEAYNQNQIVDLLAHSASANLVAWWKMGTGDTFPTLTDSSISGNDGTMINMTEGNFIDSAPSYQENQFSLSFDGTNEYVSFGDVLDLDSTDAFSVGAWFYPESSSEEFIVSKVNAAGQGWSLRRLSNAKLQFNLESTAGTGLIVQSSRTADANLWSHGVVTCSGTGIHTQSVNLDGVNDFIDFGNNHDFDRLDSFSTFGWFKTTATGGFLIAKRDTTANNRGWGIGIANISGTGYLDLLFSNVVNSNEIRVRAEVGISDNVWHHFAFTYDGSSAASGVTTYIDGLEVLATVVNDTLTGTTLNTSNLLMGARSNGTGAFYAGYLVGLGVVDFELSAAQVAQIYNNGIGIDPTGFGFWNATSSYWRLDQTETFPTIIDQGTPGYNGTMTNMTAGDFEDLAPRKLSLYLNASDVFSITQDTSVASAVTTAELRIGASDNVATPYWTGKIDEVAIWNRQLSAEEVLEIFNLGETQDLSTLASEANLRAWWRLGDGYRDSAIDEPFAILDSGPDGYDGYMTNMETYDFNELVPFETRTFPQDPDNIAISTLAKVAYYKMRAVDDGLPSPGYIYWVVTGIPDFDATFAPTLAGSIVAGSIRVVDQWVALTFS